MLNTSIPADLHREGAEQLSWKGHPTIIQFQLPDPSWLQIQGANNVLYSFYWCQLTQVN